MFFLHDQCVRSPRPGGYLYRKEKGGVIRQLVLGVSRMDVASGGRNDISIAVTAIEHPRHLLMARGVVIDRRSGRQF